MVQHDFKGQILFFHTNLDKLSLKLPDKFSDYRQRWQFLYPGNISLLDWGNPKSVTGG
eukprot:gene10146-8048_t